MGGLIVANPDAGSASLPRDELRSRFAGADVVTCDEESLRGLAADPARWSYVGAAGGDGTVRAVASGLVGTGVALVPVPAGTKNHFAKALGVFDLEDAARAVDGCEVAVDVGSVNGRYFLNNSSVGAYPRVVERREGHERFLPRSLARLVATVQEIRHGRPLRVRIDGRPQRVWLVFVGNGAYGGELGDLAERETLQGNVLDVRVVSARGKFPRTRLVLALATGRLRSSPVVSAWTCAEVEVDLGGGQVTVALDGELETCRSPLRYRSVPGALIVRVPGTSEVSGTS